MAQINVDYSVQFCEMYVSVGKVSLRTSMHLEWLAQCQSTERPDCLPSWCPNFDAQNEASPFYYEYYFAGFLQDTPSKPHVEFLAGTDHLLIKGVQIATIKTVAEVSEKWDVEGGLGSVQEKFSYTSLWMNEWLEQARAVLSIPAPIIPAAFLRTLIADVLVGQTGHTDEQLQALWKYMQFLMERLTGKSATTNLSGEEETLAYNFLDSIFHACRFRRFFTTADLRLALGPDGVKVGDRVVIFKNACMPFITRKLEHSNAYRLLGPAYVRGLMMGQVFGLTNGNQWELLETA